MDNPLNDPIYSITIGDKPKPAESVAPAGDKPKPAESAAPVKDESLKDAIYSTQIVKNSAGPPPPAGSSPPSDPLAPIGAAIAGGAAGFLSGALNQIFGSPSDSIDKRRKIVDLLEQKVGDLDADYRKAMSRAAVSGNPMGQLELTQELRARQMALRQAEDVLFAIKSEIAQNKLPTVESISETAELARRTVPNASGVTNYTRAMNDIPEALASQAQDMTTGKNVRGMGAGDIADRYHANVEKTRQLGMGDFRTPTGGGSIAQPSRYANVLDQEYAERLAQQAAQRANTAQYVALRDLSLQNDLQQAGQARNVAAQDVRQTTQDLKGVGKMGTSSDKLERQMEKLAEARGRVPSGFFSPVSTALEKAGEFIGRYPKTLQAISGAGAGLQGYEAYESAKRARSPLDYAQAGLDTAAATGSTLAALPFVPAPVRGVGALIGAGIPLGKLAGENVMRLFPNAGFSEEALRQLRVK
jgi:hypothetical protein